MTLQSSSVQVIVVLSIPVSIAFGASAVAFAKERTLRAFTQLIGATCFVIVIFAHIAEAFNLFPAMGWGRPNTLGHYLDLACAVIGVILLPVGYFARKLARRGTSRGGTTSIEGHI